MTTRSRSIASAFVGGLGLLCISGMAHAQGGPRQPQPLTRIAAVAPGSILGVVQDERGAPVAGAMVSALGASTAFVYTDRAGRFEMRSLSPGPYLLRAHLSGYVASRGQIIDVRASVSASSSIALRHAASGTGPYPVLAAGFGDSAVAAPPPPEDAGAVGTTGSLPNDDHGETAWRLRHARRGVLKDATIPDVIFSDDDPAPPNGFGPSIFGRVTDSSARFASNFFTGTPFSGQFNLLTTSSFETPQQLFSTDSFARSIAYVSLGAPVDHADWTVRGAMTQGDIASWIVAGEYLTRAPARHRYDLGLSYATQRFDVGNPAAPHDVTDGSRNAGTVYGFDTFAVTSALTLTYGARYSHYDYLEHRSLLSPRVALTLSPAAHFRINTSLSQRATAPGAEEFLASGDTALLLPPQRTFSALNPGTPLVAERTTHAEVSAERDMGAATVSLRAFHQQVSDQLVTMFGVEVPGMPGAELGHYFLANTGNVNATGFGAGFRTAVGEHLHGSIEYSETSAQWLPESSISYLMLLAPSALTLEAQRIHDVTTAIESELPRTATRVMVLYRVSNAFARASSGGAAGDGPGIDTRFDVQVRQSLPFMDFTSAKWEMLFAVRNFFRDPAADQSVYDELLVVRPPKRVVGGLTLHF
jgi:hypothetical protein